MSRSKNTIRFSDFSTIPIKLKYTSSYTSASLNAAGITIYSGINGAVNVSGSLGKTTVNYITTRHLYYSNYLTGSNLTTTSSYDNFLQSSAASGSNDWDNRYFPTESNSQIKVISIPRQVYGERISRGGFYMSSSAYQIIDDGNGNVIDSKVSNIHVGNIIYGQGIVVVTNQDYINIFDLPTTTTTSTTSTTTTAAPTTSTTSTTTTAVPTTTTSTTTTSTTIAPTTTTSTTSTTTTAAPTTSTTSTTTTAVPTTTTSTTSTTTTGVPTTTTTSTTTSTTTTPIYYQVQMCTGGTPSGATYIINATDVTPIVNSFYKLYAPTVIGSMDGTNCWKVISTSVSTPDGNGTFGTGYADCSCGGTTTTSTTSTTTTIAPTTTSTTSTTTTIAPTTTSTTTSTTTPTPTTTSTTTSTTTPSPTTTSTTTSTTTVPPTTTSTTTSTTTPAPTYYYYDADQYLNCLPNGQTKVIRSTTPLTLDWVCGNDNYQYHLTGINSGTSYDTDANGSVWAVCTSLSC